MTTFTEGNLQIAFPAGAVVQKFDDRSHGLSHCMKAVDFIVELKDRYLFIEIKDPQHPESRREERDEWAKKFLACSLDEDLKYKYRDSFLYEWACGKVDKPIHYYVLVALDTLDGAELIARTDALKRIIPLDGPPAGRWTKKVVDGCAVFNIATWNEKLRGFPVTRLPGVGRDNAGGVR
ncbi:MAG: hypothetical protein HY897_09570 [Deltaproteobacteria bacterium]|nr:hypothetical protein [Deltaproteobacteria bacterium]